MKREKIIVAVIISVTIVVGAWFISNMDLYIKDVSNVEAPGNLVTNTISVNGNGKVYVQPDVVNLKISVEEIENTTQLAQQKVNEKINDIKKILTDNNIDSKNIQTTNVRVQPEYDYKKEGRELLGYKATHQLNIKIKEANTTNKDSAGKIIDQISKLGGVRVDNIGYDVDDKTPYYSEARKLAMKKANQKADELAKVAGVKIKKPISISENISNRYPPVPVMRNTYSLGMGEMDSSSKGDVSLGELEIDLTVSVVYGIE